MLETIRCRVLGAIECRVFRAIGCCGGLDVETAGCWGNAVGWLVVGEHALICEYRVIIRLTPSPP
jgi:hypothetical protein